MGGIFSVVKVREGIGANDYIDPGWYKHPEGTVAYEVPNELAGQPPRSRSSKAPTRRAVEVDVVKLRPKSGPLNY